MNAVDWVIVAVVAASLLIGVLRGFTREIVSLAGWIAGAVLSMYYASTVGEALPFDIAWPTARAALGALLILAGCVLTASLISWVLGRILLAAKLTLTDRLWGALFGVVRGVVIVLVAVLFLSRTAAAQHAAWKSSVFLPHAEAAVRFASPWVSEVVKHTTAE